MSRKAYPLKAPAMTASDVIVIGLGTAGSATCMELARRGISVIGVDAFRPPHTLGSHHGESRSIRRAYLEGSAYVPLALRAWELWQKLERDAGTTLLTPTGNLTIGPPDCPAVAGFLASATACDIPHQALTGAEIRRRWPQLTPPDTFVAGLEVEAGIIAAERGIRTLLAEALKAGAILRFDERVKNWSASADRVAVHTSTGNYEAGRLLLSAGAGNKSLLEHMGGMLTPKRVPVHWVNPPESADFNLGSFPVNFWQIPASDPDAGAVYREFYSLPVTRTGGDVKVAPHNNLADWVPEHPCAGVTTEEKIDVRDFLKAYLPALALQKLRSDTCIYTLTPDGDFCMGHLAGHGNVFTVALAGHGFKFAPVLGEVLADLLEGMPPAVDIAAFSPARFS